MDLVWNGETYGKYVEHGAYGPNGDAYVFFYLDELNEEKGLIISDEDLHAGIVTVGDTKVEIPRI